MRPETVAELVRQIEVKDRSTAAHTWRVVLYARSMAEEIGMDGDDLRLVTHAAALHDLGKLDTPSEILQKPARLTPDEFEIVTYHPVSGYARLLDLDVRDELILDLVRYHHERWDGGGYPYHLKGEQIPVVALVFAVIDAFDAMTSVRPYRTDVGPEAAERALTEIERESGTHYWPEAVRMFAELYRTGRLDFVLSHFNDAAGAPDYEHNPDGPPVN
ncbi:MAG: HD domain-containing protein [Phycisphaerales bacterium]